MSDQLILALVSGTLLGAALGSFLGCAAWRLPRRISMNGRSFCPGCNKPVPFYLNVPVLGFLLLRGRSQCCKTPLSRGYLVYEVLSCVVGVGLAVLLGVPALFGIAIAIMIGVGVAGQIRSSGATSKGDDSAHGELNH